MTDLNFQSVTHLTAHYAAGTLSPVEVLEATLTQIDRVDEKVRAYCIVDADAARRAAQASEARWAAKQPLSALDGVPANIKDVFLVEGHATRKGSRTSDPSQRATEESPCTARLREAGAVLIGKTTLPEFGWKATGDSPLTGSTLNPWSHHHTAGGSSAGAAASLAAGTTTLAVGSDGGGSIRIPASFCGVYGLKPTQGVVPYFPRGPMGSLSHCGPMARGASDLALMLDALAGLDPRDAMHGPAQTRSFLEGTTSGVRGLRIAYSPALGYITVDSEIAHAVRNAALAFAWMGAIVEEVDPGFQSPQDSFNVLWKAGAAHLVTSMGEDQRALLDPGLRAAALEGTRFSAQDIVRADVERTNLGEHMGRFHQRYDLLLTPAVAVPPLLAGEVLSDPSTESEWIDWAGFSYPFNMTRQPAASVPCGFTSKGLPIGLQIVAALHQDALVLRAAHAHEQSRPPISWPAVAQTVPA